MMRMSLFVLALLAAACPEVFGTQCAQGTCSSGNSEEVQEVIKTSSMVQKNTLTLSKSALDKSTVSVVYGSSDNTCPSGSTRIADLGACRAAMPFIEGGDPDGFMGTETSHDFPAGCYFCSEDACGDSGGVWFNEDESGAQHAGAKPICSFGFEVLLGQTIFVGDSDIDYWHTSSDVIPGSYNLGIGGATCNDVTKEIDFILERFEPKRVVLVCGENDLSGGGVAKTFQDWTTVVRKISDAGVPIVQLGTKPEADSKNLHKKYLAYDTKIKAVVASLALDTSKPPIVFVDSFRAFIELGNKDKYYDPDEAPDYLHLGPEGYALWNGWLQNALSNRLGCVLWNGDKCVLQVNPGIGITMDPECPVNYWRIDDEAECNAAMGLVEVANNIWQGAEEAPGWPSGCYYCPEDVEGCDTGTWFNTADDGEFKEGLGRFCRTGTGYA